MACFVSEPPAFFYGFYMYTFIYTQVETTMITIHGRLLAESQSGILKPQDLRLAADVRK